MTFEFFCDWSAWSLPFGVAYTRSLYTRRATVSLGFGPCGLDISWSMR